MPRFIRRLGIVFTALLLAACNHDAVVAPTGTPQVAAPVHRHSSQSPSEVRTIFGPRVFARRTGAPAAESFSLQGYAPDATLHIANGNADGSHRVTAGTVTVDGVEVVGNSDFKKSTGSIDRPITLRNSTTVSVQLASSPGDQITISIDGHLATSAAVSPGTTSTVHLLGDEITLTVPAGATGSALTITSDPAPAPSVEAVPGTTVDMGPTGTQFNQPVTLSIAFDPAVLPPGARAASLHMNWWNVDHWEALPGNSVDMVHGIVSAQTTHFTTFALLPNEIEFCQSDPASEHDLATAISHIPAGGTVYVCDGSQTANMVTIDRPMTLAAEHAGLATIVQTDTATTGMSVLRLTNVPSGTVAIRDLRIQSAWIGLLAQGAYDQLSVTGTTFAGTNVSNTTTTGVRLTETSVATAKVVFDNDTFTGSSLGLDQHQPVDIDVFHSSFHDLGTFALLIYSVNGSSNPSPTNTPIERTARVQWNTFTNCGNSVCIAIEQAGRDTVRYNQISMPSGSLVDGIFVLRSGQPVGLTEPIVVSDNTISGHGPAADSSDQSQWGVRFALRSIGATGGPIIRDVFDRNTVNTAFVAFDIRNPGAVSATDNHVSNVYGLMNVLGSSALVAHRNDFIGYHYSIATGLVNLPTAAPTGVSTSPGALTCNYWGSTSGPANLFPGAVLTSYTPYSTVPIAGNGSVSCDPGAIPTTIRACPTPSSDGTPTLPTIQDAVTSVPDGGTVLVCDGTFSVPNLGIQRPVAIRAEGPGMPTVDAAGAARILNISNVTAGNVTISGLRFTGGTSQQVVVGSNTLAATISGNEFHPNQTNPFGVTPRGSIAALSINGFAIGTLDFQNNTIVGGDIGVTLSSAANATVHIAHNTFTGQVAFGAFVFSGTDGNYSLDHNAFTDCGGGLLGGTCLQIMRHTAITNNTFTVNFSRPTANVIFVGTPATDLVATQVIGNTVTGVGGTGSRSSAASYPIQTSAIQGASTSSVVAIGNTITNAVHGIAVNQSAAVVASDNVVTKTIAPLWVVSGVPGSQMTANWNDFSDYLTAIDVSASSNLTGMSIHCNWWGSAVGPNPVNALVVASAYTPFATAAVAGQPHTGCTP